jgi:hypothetical protein
MERKQVMHAPTMIGDASGHRGCAFLPSVAEMIWTTAAAESQAVMTGAEVVDGTDQVHGVLQAGQVVCQGARAAHQRTHARTESGIQAFDIGGVDAAAALGVSNESLDGSSAALYDAALDGYDVMSGIALTTWAMYTPRHGCKRFRPARPDRGRGVRNT